MKLIETASRWGNMFNMRYYIDGVRVSRLDFDRAYVKHGCKPHTGVDEKTSFGYRKTWLT